MKVPEKYYCDFCGKELTTNYEKQKKTIIALCFRNTDEFYVNKIECDICDDCYPKVSNVRYDYGGKNLKFIRE